MAAIGRRRLSAFGLGPGGRWVVGLVRLTLTGLSARLFLWADVPEHSRLSSLVNRRQGGMGRFQKMTNLPPAESDIGMSCALFEFEMSALV